MLDNRNVVHYVVLKFTILVLNSSKKSNNIQLGTSLCNPLCTISPYAPQIIMHRSIDHNKQSFGLKPPKPATEPFVNLNRTSPSLRALPILIP